MKKPTEPKPRYATEYAMNKIAELLDIQRDITMQDWTYEIADSAKIDLYWTIYQSLQTEDERFTMMEILIQATDELEEKEFDKYWAKLKDCLLQEWQLHQFTIYYWCCFDVEDLEDCFFITEVMRKLWQAHC